MGWVFVATKVSLVSCVLSRGLFTLNLLKHVFGTLVTFFSTYVCNFCFLCYLKTMGSFCVIYVVVHELNFDFF